MAKRNLQKKIFKDKEVEATPLEQLKKHKDRWQQGRKLIEMQKEFPHDAVLRRMIKEEFKENRLFKFPEEYDVYDDEEELARKLVTAPMKLAEGDTTKARDAAQELKKRFEDKDKMLQERQHMDVVNAKFKKDVLERDIEATAVRYKKQMKERLHGMEQTVREFLSSSY